MTRLHKTALLGLLWLFFGVAASATTITVDKWNFVVDGDGGGFQSYLNGDSSQTFEAYCVDYRSSIDPSDTYPVNVDNLAIGISDTRYGTTSQSGFSFQNAPNGMTFGDAVNRYLLAGWLTTQYDSDATNSRDIGIQNAIWNLLDTNSVNHMDGDVVTWEDNAVIWESTQSKSQLMAFMTGVTVYTSTDVAGDSDLNNNDSGNRYSIGKQELVTVSPEPGMLIPVAGGLAMLGLLRRRTTR